MTSSWYSRILRNCFTAIKSNQIKSNQFYWYKVQSQDCHQSHVYTYTITCTITITNRPLYKRFLIYIGFTKIKSSNKSSNKSCWKACFYHIDKCAEQCADHPAMQCSLVSNFAIKIPQELTICLTSCLLLSTTTNCYNLACLCLIDQTIKKLTIVNVEKLGSDSPFKHIIFNNITAIQRF